MTGEDFEFYLAQMAKNAFKLSTMAGENFEFYLAQMAKVHLNYPPWLEKILNFT